MGTFGWRLVQDFVNTIRHKESEKITGAWGARKTSEFARTRNHNFYAQHVRTAIVRVSKSSAMYFVLRQFVHISHLRQPFSISKMTVGGCLLCEAHIFSYISKSLTNSCDTLARAIPREKMKRDDGLCLTKQFLGPTPRPLAPYKCQLI